MSGVDRLTGVAIFAAAAEAGSFTRAGQRLGLSKSGVAKAVLRLEERVGARLINRTTRRFALTTEGQAFYETCSRMLAELQAAEAALAAGRLRPRGLLRVDLPVVFGRRWALPVLLRVAASNPDLSMDVTFTDRRTNLVEEGVDLAMRIGDLDDSATLMTRRLGSQESVLCASPDYLRRQGEPVTLDELDAHVCIVHTRGGQPLGWQFVEGSGTLVERASSGRLSFNDAEAICEAALGGEGIAMLSTWLIADHLREGRLRAVLPDVQTRGFPIHVLWPGRRETSSKVRVVVDALAASFLPRPPWDRERGHPAATTARRGS